METVGRLVDQPLTDVLRMTDSAYRLRVKRMVFSSRQHRGLR